MASFNKIIVAGNLTKDIELRSLPDGGDSVANLSLAVNNVSGKGKDKKSDAMFFDVPVYGKIAENCEKYLKKGSSALVDGYLYTRTWETKEGKEMTSLCIGRAAVTFLDSAGGNDSKESSDSEEKVEDAPISTENEVATSTDVDEEVIEADDCPF